ncbi:MAG: hypothetical protein IVW36_02225 [Dehalococcoidia bacterium]|nr:hypothetical protein [Dehalococcoidia bacterium]
MKLYLAFLLVFLALGLCTRRIGGWGYLLIAGATISLAGLYIVSTTAWS